MKKLLSTMLLVLVGMTALAQTERIWNDVVIGYTNVHWSEVTKVGLYANRTEVSLRINHRNGSWISIAKSTCLEAGGKQYPIKDAPVIGLDNRYTLTTDAFDFTLVFEPVPQDAKALSVLEPNGWMFLNLRSTDDLPEGITDTYWRNEATGDWLIGFTPKHVIYNNKVYDIATQTEKKDVYTFTLVDGTTIKVGKMKKGLRSITIAPNDQTTNSPNHQTPIVCNPITTAALSDYPTKDLCQAFVDNGYSTTDSVTIVGWLKDMPEELWKKSREFEVSFENIFADKQESAFAKMDSLGRFTLKMPLLNTSQVFLDWGRTMESSVVEPGKTYFFLNDFKTGQKLWMGDDVRVQNELIAYPHAWPNDRIEHENEGRVTAMQFKALTDSTRAANMAKLQACVQEHPNLSQRYIDYVTGYYQTAQGESMMQARFSMPAYKLPQEYMDYVGQELWRNTIRPYTLYRDFGVFMRDFLDQLHDSKRSNRGTETVEAIHRLEQQGIVTLTADEEEALKTYETLINTLETSLQNSHDSEIIDSLVNAFNTNPTVEKVSNLFSRIGDPIRNELATSGLRENLAIIDSVGCDQSLRDIYLARYLYRQIDATRQPAEPSIMTFAEQQIQTPAALAAIKAINDKYIAIANKDFANAASLRPSSDVEGMSDGEKIFRKIIEPYKGRIVYLDIWGTWCGPCKSNLKESWKVKEALKDYDIVYLYLCNRSSDESWKNVIKEYDLTGPNCIHYNLPEDQQSAIEHYLNVNSFPTYKLIDKQGNIHDLHWLHHENLEGFKETIANFSR